MKSIFKIVALLLSYPAFAQIVFVTNTNDAGPGSLRQAIIAANSNPSITSIQFSIPTTDPNFNAVHGTYTIGVASMLPDITRQGLVIDGYSQKINQTPANSGFIGSAIPTGYPASGTTALIPIPEIRIVPRDTNLQRGLTIAAKNVTIRGLGIAGFGFNFTNNDGNIVLLSGADGAIIESNVLGSMNHTIAIPTPNKEKTAGNNVVAFDVKNGKLLNNIIAFAGSMGAFFNYQCSGWEVRGNEFVANGRINVICDNIDVAYKSSNFLIEKNAMYAAGANGLDLHNATGSHTIRYNTIFNSGQLRVENSGIRVYGQNNTIHNNNIYANHGAGIMVTTDALYNTMQSNRFKDNGNYQVGTFPKTNNIAINLNAPGENNLRGTAPFYTLNDLNDADNGGNELHNFPVIDQAYIQGGMLHVKGFARPGAQVELYVGDLFTGAVFPQGVEPLGIFTEGSADDHDATTGSYGPGAVNGTVVGQDATNRFHFILPKPASVNAGTLLTALSTLGGNTSEFGNAATVSSQPIALYPTLECIYQNQNGQYIASFAYTNTTSSPITINAGVNNQVTGGTVIGTQPTTFAPGTTSGALKVTFASSTTWTISGQSATADATSVLCPVDLAVTASVDNSAPDAGNNVTFTIQFTNLSTTTPTADAIFQIVLPDSLQYISHSSAGFTFTPVTGVVTIPYMNPGQTFTLILTVKANGSGLLTAGYVNSAQPDNNAANNTASVNITTQCASGGNDGGIESHGSMSAAINHRNFNRLKSGRHHFYTKVEALPLKADEGSLLAGRNGLLLSDLFPANGPENTTGRVVTPKDLMNITNALDIYSLDYFRTGSRRLGSILGIETPSGEVYEHTKVVCDRLNGAAITRIFHMQAAGHPFIMAEMTQENGDIDYNISFVVYQYSDGSFAIDNRWNLTEYRPQGAERVFNFQVWTVSPHLTVKMVEEIIALVAQHGTVRFINQSPAIIPTVWVESGRYIHGKLALKIRNTVSATDLLIDGSITRHENQARQPLFFQHGIPASEVSYVEIPMGYLFDAGFSIVNNVSGGRDQLYVADGMWGIDYEQGGLLQPAFQTFENQTLSNNDGLALERAAMAGGLVKDYFSIYRTLRPGANRSLELTEYNAIRFTASATRDVKVVVTLPKKSIRNWSEQYRTTITLTPAKEVYEIRFDELKSSLGGEFDPADLVAIVWTITGEAAQFSPISMMIEQAAFIRKQGASVISLNTGERGITAYPNPAIEYTNLLYELPADARASIEVTDITGRRVKFYQGIEGKQGLNQYRISTADLPTGSYVVTVRSGRYKKSTTIVRM
ncbi:MAG: T9SS type A sorting domain-containing protein [Thermaurantimonas sp.]|uniref:T9SS type A sorting domain-containing protein n=1 Tax=Thermaurantimonas sp. TaxID=2681568 RepID=UPI00391A5DCC